MQAIKQWVLNHPHLTAWIVLAVGMNAIRFSPSIDLAAELAAFGVLTN